MDQKKKFHILSYFSYASISLLSFRKLLITDGVIGHRWDWSIPYTALHLSRLFEDSLYFWNPQALGFAWDYGSNILILNGLIGVLGKLGLSGAIFSKILVVFSTTVACISMFHLSKVWIRRYNVSNFSVIFPFISGLIYGFSPYFFNMMSGGALMVFFGYPFAPLMFLFYLRSIEENGGVNKKYLVLAALTGLIVAHHRTFYTSLLFILVFFTPFSSRPKLRFKVLLYIFLLQVPLFAYWMLPVIANLNQVLGTSIELASGEIVLKNWISASSTLREAFVITGYWNPIFQNSIPRPIYPLWVIGAYGLIIIAFLGTVYYRTKSTFYLLISLILALFLAKTGKPPLGTINVWFYENIFIFKMYRSPQTLLFPVAFLYPLLIAVGLTNLSKRFRFKNGFYISMLILSFTFISPFYISGDLGSVVSVFKTPPGYIDIDNYLVQDNAVYRIAPIPIAHSVKYKETKYQPQGVGTGGDPWITTSLRPAVFATTSVAREYQNMLSRNLYLTNNATIFLLSKSNTKYLILRRDVIPNFESGSEIFNVGSIEEFLETNTNFEKKIEYDFVSLWLYKNFKPRIHSTNNLIYTKMNMSYWYSGEVPLNDEYDIIFSEDLSSKMKEVIENFISGSRWNGKKSSADFITSFRQKDRTKYIVNINATKPFVLILSENYHTDWRIYEGNVDFLTAFFKPNKFQETHFKINGYANAWYIDPEKIDKDKDGSFVITIYFWSQSLLYAGYIVSGLTLIAYIAYIRLGKK